MPGIENYITGGAEGDCAPPIAIYAILIVVVLLVLNEMGKISLNQEGMWNKSPNASASTRFLEQDQADLRSGFSGTREGYEYNDAMSPGQGGPADDFDKMLDAAAGAQPSADIDAAGSDPNPFDSVVASGGYGDYAGTYASAERDPVDAAEAKARWNTNKEAAQAHFWTLVGGENSCGIPVASSAFAEALSLSAANGDLPCGTATAGGKSDFAADLDDA